MNPEDTEVYRLLLASTTLPLLILDQESLRILDVSDQACRLYGYSRAELIGKPGQELRPADEVSRFEKYLAQEMIYGDAGAWVHKKKDGTTVRVNIRYHAIEYAGRKARFIIVTPSD
jgi:PAS domain S-box-containing protein